MITYLSIPPYQQQRSSPFSPPSWSRLPVRSAEWLACLPAGDRACRCCCSGWLALTGQTGCSRTKYVELDAALQSTDRPVFGAAFDP